jgi:hypothetical protein
VLPVPIDCVSAAQQGYVSTGTSSVSVHPSEPVTRQPAREAGEGLCGAPYDLASTHFIRSAPRFEMFSKVLPHWTDSRAIAGKELAAIFRSEAQMLVNLPGNDLTA